MKALLLRRGSSGAAAPAFTTIVVPGSCVGNVRRGASKYAGGGLKWQSPSRRSQTYLFTTYCKVISRAPSLLSFIVVWAPNRYTVWSIAFISGIGASTQYQIHNSSTYHVPVIGHR